MTQVQLVELGLNEVPNDVRNEILKAVVREYPQVREQIYKILREIKIIKKREK